MFGILADSFRTATRTDAPADARHHHQARPHRPRTERTGPRSSAELEAHLIARRRY